MTRGLKIASIISLFALLVASSSGCGVIAAALPMSSTVSGGSGDNYVEAKCKGRFIFGSPSPESCARAERNLQTAAREKEDSEFCHKDKNADTEYCKQHMRNLGGRDDDSRQPFNVNMARSGILGVHTYSVDAERAYIRGN